MQLKLDIYNQNTEISFLQQQIDAINESQSKIRKKLFAEITALKKSIFLIQSENVELKEKIYENEKVDWIYGQNGCLFDVSANQG